ncbi:MAG: hypothetical protein KIT09_09395 [Bryobacteraceae bacterium]|nr:hypothetical protein [Bryobacteraceae bacterium]
MSQGASPTTIRRLKNSAAILKTLDHRRAVANDPHLGSNIERLVIGRELRELEEEIARNPGPLAAYVKQKAHVWRRRIAFNR